MTFRNGEPTDPMVTVVHAGCGKHRMRGSQIRLVVRAPHPERYSTVEFTCPACQQMVVHDGVLDSASIELLIDTGVPWVTETVPAEVWEPRPVGTLNIDYLNELMMDVAVLERAVLLGTMQPTKPVTKELTKPVTKEPTKLPIGDPLADQDPSEDCSA